MFDGKEVSYRTKDLSALREKVGIVLQNPDDQIFSATVEEDVAFGPLNLGLSHEEVEGRVDEALRLTGMEAFRERPSQQLSFGQRKRVALAGSLAMRPKVLIMDEPTAGLDPQMVRELMELLDKLVAQGMTAVISTHDVDLAYSWADEAHVLAHGRSLFSGRLEDFFSSDLVERSGLTPPSVYELDRASDDGHTGPRARRLPELMAKQRRGRSWGRLTVEVSTAVGPANGAMVGSFGPVSRSLLAQTGRRFPPGPDEVLREIVQGRDAHIHVDAELVAELNRRIARLEAIGGEKMSVVSRG